MAVTSGGLLVATSPTYSSRKPNSFCGSDRNHSFMNKKRTTLKRKKCVHKGKAHWQIYLELEFISCSQTGMVGFHGSGHDEALVVRGVTMEQVPQVTVALWSYSSSGNTDWTSITFDKKNQPACNLRFRVCCVYRRRCTAARLWLLLAEP